MKLNRSRTFILLLIGIAAVAIATTAWVRAAGRNQTTGQEIPVAVVQRGSMSMDVSGTGELQASHKVMLTAPAIGGDTLQITKLVPTGHPVKKGDIVIEFDPGGQEFKLEQSQSDLEQAQQEIVKAQADAAVLAARDKVALLKAHYDVRKAELDVQKGELLSRIDAEKNQLALDQANRSLAELEEDVKSHAQSGQADIFLAKEKYNKAKLSMDAAQENLAKMRVAAPMDGMVSIRKNMMAAGGFFFSGMTLPEYRAGDQVQPGSSIAQIVDPMQMDLLAHLGETNRSNLRTGEPVEVSFYAVPDQVFHGSVATIAGMASQAFIFDSTAGGNFDVTVAVPSLDPRLRPGLTADLHFEGDTRKDVLFVPRIAVFLKDGKHIVYVQSGSGYEQREVKVESANDSRAAITGVAEGSRVALRDPTAPVRTSATGAGGIH